MSEDSSSLFGLISGPVPSKTEKASTAKRTFVPMRVEYKGVDLVERLTSLDQDVGRYENATPYAAASKVATKYVAKAKRYLPDVVQNDNDDVCLHITLQETTKDSKGRVYEYSVVRSVIDHDQSTTPTPPPPPPTTRKALDGVVFRHKNKVRSVRRKVSAKKVVGPLKRQSRKRKEA